MDETQCSVFAVNFCGRWKGCNTNACNKLQPQQQLSTKIGVLLRKKEQVTA